MERIFSSWLRRVWKWLQSRWMSMGPTPFTVVSQTEQNGHTFLVLYNGYDYEVKVFMGEDRLVHHSMSYANLEDANVFVSFYKKVL